MAFKEYSIITTLLAVVLFVFVLPQGHCDRVTRFRDSFLDMPLEEEMVSSWSQDAGDSNDSVPTNLIEWKLPSIIPHLLRHKENLCPGITGIHALRGKVYTEKDVPGTFPQDSMYQVVFDGRYTSENTTIRRLFMSVVVAINLKDLSPLRPTYNVCDEFPAKRWAQLRLKAIVIDNSNSTNTSPRENETFTSQQYLAFDPCSLEDGGSRKHRLTLDLSDMLPMFTSNDEESIPRNVAIRFLVRPNRHTRIWFRDIKGTLSDEHPPALLFVRGETTAAPAGCDTGLLTQSFSPKSTGTDAVNIQEPICQSPVCGRTSKHVNLAESVANILLPASFRNIDIGKCTGPCGANMTENCQASDDFPDMVGSSAPKCTVNKDHLQSMWVPYAGADAAAAEQLDDPQSIESYTDSGIVYIPKLQVPMQGGCVCRA